MMPLIDLLKSIGELVTTLVGRCAEVGLIAGPLYLALRHFHPAPFWPIFWLTFAVAQVGTFIIRHFCE